MEKEEIILGLEVDTGNSVNDIEAIAGAMLDVDAATKHAAEEYEILNTQLKDYRKVAIAAGKDSPIGKEAIKRAAELQERLHEVDKSISEVRVGGQKLNSAISVSHTALASYGALEAVTHLAGNSNEALLKTMVKLQAIEHVLGAAESARTAIMENQAKVTKAMALIQKGYSLAVGTSSGALKVFRLALIATGIGAIIVLLGLLIANWDKVKKAVDTSSEAFQNFKEKIKFFLPMIYAMIIAYEQVIKVLQEMGLVASVETEQMIADTKRRIEALEKEKGAIGNKFDFEIAKARAAGKDTFKLEQDKRNAIMENLKLQAKAIIALAKLTGEFDDEQREKAQQLADTFKELAQASAVARIAQEKKVTDNYIKELEKKKEAGDEKARLDAEKMAEEDKRAQAQFDLMNELMLSAQELEIVTLKKGYEDKFDLARGNNELELELIREQAEAVAEIEEEYAMKKLEAESERAFAMAELKMELKELEGGELSDTASPEEIREYYELRNEIEEEQFELEMERLALEEETKAIPKDEALAKREVAEKKHSNRVKKLKDEEVIFSKKLDDKKTKNAIGAASGMLSNLASIAGEGSDIAKAAAVGQATMDTYKAANAAYAAGSSVGGPAGVVMGPLAAGLAITAGILNVQKILSTKTPGGGGGGGGGGALPSAPSLNAAVIPTTVPSNPDGTLTADLLGGGGDNPVDDQEIKVTVLESDISNAMKSNEQSVATSEL